jgi:hypothetical protein
VIKQPAFFCPVSICFVSRPEILIGLLLVLLVLGAQLGIDLSVVSRVLAISTGTMIEVHTYCHRQHLTNLKTSALR